MPTSHAARKKFRSCGSIQTEPTRLLDWAEDDAKLSVLQVTDQPSLLFMCNGISGERVPLRLVLALRVAAVKQVAEGIFGIPAEEMTLSYKGRILGNRQTLLDGGVEARQCIHVTIATGVGHARLLDILIDATRSGIAEPFVIQLKPCDLVIHAKTKIAELTGLKLDSQRLTLSGHTLANERRLSDCGIRENSILQVTCTNGAASAPNPSVAVSGCRAPRAQLDASAKKHRCQGESLFLTILQTWPPQRKQRLWLQKARTIGQLKEKLKDFFQVSPEQQILFHTGRRLQNQHTIEFYNLEGGECIQLMVQGGPRVAAGPVALRAESPTFVTLPLPPQPSSVREVPEWFPRLLHPPTTQEVEVQPPEVSEASRREPQSDTTGHLIAGEPVHAQHHPAVKPELYSADDVETMPMEEPCPTVSKSVDGRDALGELVLQASVALLSHAMSQSGKLAECE